VVSCWIGGSIQKDDTERLNSKNRRSSQIERLIVMVHRREGQSASDEGPIFSSQEPRCIGQPATCGVSNGRALIEFDNTAGLVGGTDYTIESMCDGGSHWSAAGTYTVATSHGPSGHTIIETDDVSRSGGTSFAARIKTPTNKNMPIYGLSVTVH
jgi:hypothetical protein